MPMAASGKLVQRADFNDLEAEQHMMSPVTKDDGAIVKSFSASGKKFNLYDANHRDAESGFFIATDVDSTEQIIGYVLLNSQKICGMNVFKIFLVRLDEDYQGLGIGTELYKLLASIKGVMSDDTQYFESRKLWAKLSTLPGYTVHAVNPKTCKLIAKDVELVQTASRTEFDKRFFSDTDQSMKDVVFLLKKSN
jgi:hypothetical protein